MAANRKNGRNTGGKFGPGNPGKPKGARSRITRAAEELLDGEAEKLTRKAIERALEGDTTALRLCLERLVPPRKDRPVEFAVPEIKGPEDALDAMGRVVSQMGSGDLCPSDAAAVMSVVERYLEAWKITDLERRLAALEEGLNGQRP